MADCGGFYRQLDRIEHVGLIEATLMCNPKQLLHSLVGALRLAICLRTVCTGRVDIDVKKSTYFVPELTHGAWVAVTLK